MSARETLFRLGAVSPYDDEFIAACEAHAAEVRAATLREAADYIEAETRNGTGNPVIFPPWAKAQQHAGELATGLRRMAEEGEA